MYLADLEDALAVFGPRLAQIYGQGETPMTITALSKADHADRDHPRWRERMQSVGAAAHRRRGPRRRRERPRTPHRRDRRGGGPRRRGDGRLLDRTRRHGRGVAGRLAAHRRRRQLRRRRVPDAAGPVEGPHHQRGDEHLSTGGRGGTAPPPRRPGRGRRRPARCGVGRGGGGLRRDRPTAPRRRPSTTSTGRASTTSPGSSGRRSTGSSTRCRRTTTARSSSGSCATSCDPRPKAPGNLAPPRGGRLMKLALYLPNFRDKVTVKELEDLTRTRRGARLRFGLDARPDRRPGSLRSGRAPVLLRHDGASSRRPCRCRRAVSGSRAGR